MPTGSPAPDPGHSNARPYTRGTMESGIHGDFSGTRLDRHYAEASQAVSYAANQLRALTEGYREAYAAELGALRREAEELELGDEPWRGNGESHGVRGEARAAFEERTAEIGRRQVELAKLELMVTQFERAWLFLQHGDASLVPGPSGPDLPTDFQMRIIEAQESERQRLAQEVHDGPAQALTNAIFQVEYIERLLDRDLPTARAEMHQLRDLLRRELGDVRTFITQLRPPLLDEIGLYGAIRDQAAMLTTATGARVEAHLEAPVERLGDAQQTVVLRIVQEALQNIRRHAEARNVHVSTRVEGEGDWVLEITDDGRGFDPEQRPTRTGEPSYGLRIMRERAELIGARFTVEARPAAGTRICVTIPEGTERR